jgi:hypothetical protein
MWICNHPYYQRNLHHNRHTFVCLHKQYHNSNIGTLVLANIPFIMHLAHIVFVNSLVMISIPFGLHLTLHVHIGTLATVYIYFKMCLALTATYILVKTCLALHVPFKTLAMVSISYKTCLALTMVKILVKMHFAHNNILDASFET